MDENKAYSLDKQTYNQSQAYSGSNTPPDQNQTYPASEQDTLLNQSQAYPANEQGNPFRQNQTYPANEQGAPFNQNQTYPANGQNAQPGMNQPYPASSQSAPFNQNLPYGQPSQPYPQQNYGQPVRAVVYDTMPAKNNNVAIAGLILGILSILGCWIPFWNLILSIAGIICSAIGLSHKGQTNGMAVGGLITSIVGFLLSLFMCLVYFIAMFA